MRITLLLLFVIAIQAGANNLYSQSARVSLNMRNATVEEILSTIEEESEFYFLYNSKLVDVDRKVSVRAKAKPIETVLNELFASTDVVYKIEDRQIILSKKEFVEAASATVAVSQQTKKQITGTVTDEFGDPLPGVNVIEKGVSNGTSTNADGHFALSVSENAVLEFSYIGYIPQEIIVGNQKELNVRLKEDLQMLDEVIVVGYGMQKKVNLTGAVAVANSEVFENKAVPNTMAALQGALPGVMVTKSSGKPGSEGYRMQIRGASSANTVNTLVIVDGVVGSLNDVNPADIESMSVLKDAAAASIYGSNAAGGVILVTTKKGRTGKPVVDVNAMFGFNTSSRLPTRLNSWDEMKMYNVARGNAGLAQPWSELRLQWMQGINLDVPDTGLGTTAEYPNGVAPSMFFPGGRWVIQPSRPNVWYSYGNVDRIKTIIEPYNPMQQYNVSVRGGSDASQYFISGGYYNRDGLFRVGPDGEERYTFRVNLNNKLSEHIFLNTSFAYTLNKVEQSSHSPENIIYQAYHYWSILEEKLPTGEWVAGNGIWDTPTRLLTEAGKDTQKNHQFDGKIELNIKNIVPGWDVNVIGSKRIRAALRDYNRRTLVYIGPLGTPTYTSGNPNNMYKSRTMTDYSSLQAFSTYHKSIAESHNFALLAGYSYEDYRYDLVQGNIRNLVTNDFYSLKWGDPISASVTDNIQTSRTIAFFGRLNYNYQEKYLFEANLRYDGSSKLAPSERWNLFPSFSVGWNISRENFFQPVGFINNLKLRASWGQLGNSDALGYYDYIGMLNSATNLPFNNTNTQYIYQSTLASPTKTWETIQTANIGIDIGVLNNRLNFSGDIYEKRNKDMLASLQVSSIIGVGLPTYNVGELKTKGWEIDISWRDRYKDFKYWVALNLSDNTNELVHYEGRNVVGRGRVTLLEGYPLNTMWGYKTDGLFQSNQEYADYGVYINARTGQGDMKYLDLDGSKRIDTGSGTLEDHGDLVLLGDDNPRYVFGINLGLEWKGFDFSCFFQGVGKRKFFLNAERFMPMYQDWLMPWKEHSDYWTPENPDAYWPRLYNTSNHSYWESDYWIQNGAYLRCKNMELGFTLPELITRKVKIEKARFFISGQDLFEFTNVFSWIDPEFSHGSTDVYPFYRSASIGINVTF